MSFASNHELVAHLIRSGALKTPVLRAAFEAVDRAHFVPPELRGEAYADHPLPIGLGQTISQPATVAFMLELLQPQPDQRVMEVGAGSGYVAALLAAVVGARGSVVAVELIPELVERAQRSLGHYQFSWLSLVIADGSQGYASGAPYDRIIVSAAARALPGELKRQLMPQGRLVIPVGNEQQDLVLITRYGAAWEERHYPGFVFVPLRGGKLT